MLKSLAETKWTNKSVVEFAQGEDPVSAVVEHVSNLVLGAMDEGWGGPPFDPIELADWLGIPIIPNASITDARTIADSDGNPVIEFNPNRAPTRVRFNVAHEIAHTIFPDATDRIRYRDHHHIDSIKEDTWQLEVLCNLAAAEILMPHGSLPDLGEEDLTIEHVIELKERFHVSAEAILIRIINHVDYPLIAFSASVRNEDDVKRHYQIDYSVAQPKFSNLVPKGAMFSTDSVLAKCTAIGYTAKGYEVLNQDAEKVWIECLGLPPMPGSCTPRVAGLAILPTAGVSEPVLVYVIHDVLDLVENEQVVMVHIINNKTPNWGGGGVANKVKRRWPEVAKKFRKSVENDRSVLRLGSAFVDELPNNSKIVHMVAQSGYGESPTPRIRYQALRQCLTAAAKVANDCNLPVVMPRIGVGNAGGRWAIVEDLVRECLCSSGVRVTVCDLPNQRGSKKDSDRQKALF